MGLFKKKEEKKVEIPKLPELPRLPELPNLPDSEKDSDELISQLPTFPRSSLGDKFSQYNIKDAITGGKENGDEEEEELPALQKPLIIKEIKNEDFSRPEKVKEAEPLFIRIDKFEEGSKNFEEVKKQISGIEKMFNNLKSVKDEEEKELNSFEEEIRRIKERVENIDNNVFSKIR